MSVLIALETNRDRQRAAELLGALIDLLRKQDDDAELTAAFTEWAAQVLLPRRFRGSMSGPLPRLEEVRTMLAETVQEWTAEWVEQGREQSIQQGQRALLCHQVAQKFGDSAAKRLGAAFERVADPARLAQVGGWIIEWETGADLFARFGDGSEQYWLVRAHSWILAVVLKRCRIR